MCWVTIILWYTSFFDIKMRPEKNTKGLWLSYSSLGDSSAKKIGTSIDLKISRFEHVRQCLKQSPEQETPNKSPPKRITPPCEERASPPPLRELLLQYEPRVCTREPISAFSFQYYIFCFRYRFWENRHVDKAALLYKINHYIAKVRTWDKKLSM